MFEPPNRADDLNHQSNRASHHAGVGLSEPKTAHRLVRFYPGHAIDGSDYAVSISNSLWHLISALISQQFHLEVSTISWKTGGLSGRD
jgi:hypothetical protein